MSDAAIELHATSVQSASPCPCCAQSSGAVHSWYTRRLTDLPWAGVPVVMHLRVRKLFCRNDACPRAVFTEQMPQIAAPHRRQTNRLWEQQRQLALAHGGAAGARTAARQGLPASAKTLLRRICHTPLVSHATPRCLGVDDWALRKGQAYGTILVDLERHRPVDLLPDRSSSTLAHWLQTHPGVEMISLDRAGEYADGAARSAPEAVQVADRFHLIQNGHQVLRRLLERHSSRLREAARAVNEKQVASTTQEESSGGQLLPSHSAASALADEVSPPQRQLSKAEQHRQARRLRRYALYSEVQRLRTEGTSIREIGRRLHVHRTTVHRFFADQFPEQSARPKRPSLLDPHLPYLEAQLRAGRDNAMQLWRELRDEHGFRGSRALVSTWVAAHRALCPPRTAARKRRGAPPASPPPELPPRFRTPSVRSAAWLLTANPDSLDDDQAQFVAHLHVLCPEIQLGQHLIELFLSLLRARDVQALDEWFARVEASNIPDLLSFAAGLRRDEAAVRAALYLPYSNGQVEGQICKLKLLKRSMYGHARFDLLKRRLLAA